MFDVEVEGSSTDFYFQRAKALGNGASGGQRGFVGAAGRDRDVGFEARGAAAEMLKQ